MARRRTGRWPGRERCLLAAGKCAVDGGAGHAEQVAQFGGGVFAGAQQFDQVRLLAGVELGLLAAQVTLGLRHPHALACPGPDEIGLKFGHHGKDVEQQPADRVGRVVYRPTEAEPHRPAGEVFSDRPCVGQ